MSRRISLVIERTDERGMRWVKNIWRPDQLAADLVKAGAEATVYLGPLEDAPEAWAYVLYGTNADLVQRVTKPGGRERLAKTIATDTNPLAACKLAEDVGLVGVLDDMGSWFASGDKDPHNGLHVKRSVAAKLHWKLWEIHGSADYGEMESIPMPLSKLILTYLEAALGES